MPNLPVKNGSFETPALTAAAGPSTYKTGSPDGWSLSSPGGGNGSGGVWKPASGEIVDGPTDGKQVLWLYGGSQVFQDTGTPVDLNAGYKLRVRVSSEKDTSLPLNSFRVAIVAGGLTGKVIAQLVGAIGRFDPSQDLVVSGNPAAGSTGNVWIILSATGGQPLFDSVVLDSSAPVPNPQPTPTNQYPSFSDAFMKKWKADMAAVHVTSFKIGFPTATTDMILIDKPREMSFNPQTGQDIQSVATKNMGLMDIMIDMRDAWNTAQNVQAQQLTDDTRNFLNDTLAAMGLPPSVINPVPAWNI